MRSTCYFVKSDGNLILFDQWYFETHGLAYNFVKPMELDTLNSMVDHEIVEFLMHV